MNIPNALNPPARILLGPGPSNVPAQVLKAMSLPLLGHLDPAFLQIMDEVKSMLQAVFQTSNALTLAISGTGSAGMETCFVNLLEPGDEVLIGVNGVFGNRMCDVAERCGAKVIRMEAPWGKPIEVKKIEEFLNFSKPKVVALVHAETSTGVLQPLAEISGLVHQAGALLLVDAVTSLGGTAVKVDEWGIDAIYSGTQKCLSAPPGLAPVSFNEKAVEKMEARTSKPQSWYLDISMVKNYWGGKRTYHHTAPITSIYALRESLRLVLTEGLAARFKRHADTHEYLKNGLEALGISFVVATAYRLPMLNAVNIPTGKDDKTIRKRLLDEFNIEIGGGLGDFAGKVWRIGLMGESCRAEHVDRLLSALKTLISAN